MQARQLSYALFRGAHHTAKGFSLAIVFMSLCVLDLYRQKLVGKQEDPAKGLIMRHALSHTKLQFRV